MGVKWFGGLQGRGWETPREKMAPMRARQWLDKKSAFSAEKNPQMSLFLFFCHPICGTKFKNWVNCGSLAFSAPQRANPPWALQGWGSAEPGEVTAGAPPTPPTLSGGESPFPQQNVNISHFCPESSPTTFWKCHNSDFRDY